MDIHTSLVAIAAGARTPATALEAAAAAIAEAFGAEAAAVLARRERRLEERGVHGALLVTQPALLAEALRTMSPLTETVGDRIVIAVPIASLDQAIGAIVVQRASESPFTAEETMRLGGVASQLVAFLAGDLIVSTIEGAPSTRERGSAPPPPTGELVLAGIAASPGIAVGRASLRTPSLLLRRAVGSLGAGAERDRVRDACERTRNDLLSVQAAVAIEIGEEHALIFGAHLLLLNDPMLHGLVERGIDAGHAAPRAVDDAFEEVARRLRGVEDPYLRERVEDIEDLRSRVVGHLVGGSEAETVDAEIVIGARTTPSLVVELKARGALGIASELGGATSHGVLLARALGIPAVVGVADLLRQVDAGAPLVVDGDEGCVVVRPTAERLAGYALRSRAADERATEFLRYRDAPSQTADGIPFVLQANIALGADLSVARENRARGIGLYRTEFPFIVRDALPSIDEQRRIYARAYETFADEPITFRLLDIAGDKLVPSRQLGVARDAFHGYRSIRILFDFPYVLRDQVQALALAASGRDLRILIPMVTSLEDVVRIKELVLAAIGLLPATVRVPLTFGAMIETPAAVEIVRELATVVDFFSVGTNDLIQYSLVVDREDPRMASETHAFHPAILRMLQRVTEQAHLAGRPVGVCGEMAARPELALALLAIGVDTLSVTPRLIPGLKRALLGAELQPLRRSLGDVLRLPTTSAIAEFLQRYV